MSEENIFEKPAQRSLFIPVPWQAWSYPQILKITRNGPNGLLQISTKSFVFVFFKSLNPFEEI